MCPRKDTSLNQNSHLLNFAYNLSFSRFLALPEGAYHDLDHLCITIIHGKNKLSFEEVCFVLLIYETRKKDKKEYWGELVEALIVRGRSQNKK